MADFAGPGLIELPGSVQRIPPCRFAFDLSASPRGGLVSFKCEVSDTDFQLMVFRLPAGDLVARLPLLGPAAVQAMAQSSETLIPYPPSVQHSLYFSPSLWSPSGRYLAYAGAPETPSTDLYVFDSASLTARHLTSGPHQTQIVGWSPDSNWVVHSSFSYGDVDTFVLATWAASVRTSEIHKLYDVNESIVAQHIVAWETPDTIITDRTAFEGCTYELRSTLIGDASRLLTPWGFSSAAFDPTTGRVAIARSEMLFCRSESPGLYSLNLRNDQVSTISHEGYWSVAWSEPLGALIARSDRGPIDLISPDGGATMSFPDAWSVLPSPDGLWVLVESGNLIRVSALSGVEAASIPVPRVHGLAWHPDATAFIVSSCEFCPSDTLQTVEYRRDDAWRAASVRSLPIAPASVGIVVVLP